MPQTNIDLLIQQLSLYQFLMVMLKTYKALLIEGWKVSPEI